LDLKSAQRRPRKKQNDAARPQPGQELRAAKAPVPKHKPSSRTAAPVPSIPSIDVFDEDAYLIANPDVATAVAEGKYPVRVKVVAARLS
jgi:hypothetical protein